MDQKVSRNNSATSALSKTPAPPPQATASDGKGKNGPAGEDYYNMTVAPPVYPSEVMRNVPPLKTEKGAQDWTVPVQHEPDADASQKFITSDYSLSQHSETDAVEDVERGDTDRRRKTRRKKKRKDDGKFASSDQKLQYKIHDVPPWYLSMILGFQHYLVMFGATVTNPLVLAPALCIAKSDGLATSQLIGTIFFVSGMVTLLQTCLGIRLPIVQGGTFTFVTPSIAILSLDAWKCPTDPKPNATIPDCYPTTTAFTTIRSYTTLNGSISDLEEPLWMPRIREIQGAIIVASMVQILIGLTGLMGLMLKFIGPLAIAPTVALAGLALFEPASVFASQQWWIALVTIILIATFSQYTKNFEVPCFHFNRREGCTRVYFPLFRLFPVILAITITWILCAILTATGVFPDDPEAWGSGASTNLYIDVMDKAPWFRIPYPGQWGMPTVSAASVLGMLSGVLASMIESLGDYYACARMADVPPPPLHAVNRAICIEGIGCVLAGLWGSGSGTTSYSENIGAIGITKVASIRVIQIGAIMMIVMGTFGKFGALFVTIPKPIIGGVFIVMFGMITAVGIANLQFVDLNSTRNLFIIGFTFFFGLTLPEYMKKNPDAVKTGVLALDQIITVLLRTHMFVGGLTGFVLDNTIPGSDEERGLLKWRQTLITSDSKSRHTIVTDVQDDTNMTRKIYDIPYITKYLEQYNWARYVPFLPTFDESVLDCSGVSRRRQRGARRGSGNSQGTSGGRGGTAEVDIEEGHRSTEV